MNNMNNSKNIMTKMKENEEKSDLQFKKGVNNSEKERKEPLKSEQNNMKTIEKEPVSNFG